MSEQETSNPLCKRCGGPIGPGSDHEEDPCMEIYIARLEAEIERLEECIRGMSAHAMKAAAEETRLREALDHLATFPSNQWQPMREFARATLGVQSDERVG